MDKGMAYPVLTWFLLMLEEFMKEILLTAPKVIAQQ
jgi:hypothetical protein